MKKLLVEEGREPRLVDMTPEEIANMEAIYAVAARLNVPQSVSRFQMMEALIDTPSPDPRFPDANALINARLEQIGGRPLRAWREASVFLRTSPLVLQLAQQFGWSEAQVDDLFVRAGNITA